MPIGVDFFDTAGIGVVTRQFDIQNPSISALDREDISACFPSHDAL